MLVIRTGETRETKERTKNMVPELQAWENINETFRVK